MRYFYSGDHAPPVSGQIRFRTTTSSDPATFPSGRDLQLPGGETWNIPLSRIARVSKYSGLRAQLLLEKLVTAKVLDSALNSSASSEDKQCIPKSVIPDTAATELRRRSALPLRTLNQTQLDDEDFVDVAGQVTPTVRFRLAPEEPMVKIRYFGGGIAFPSDSHGFFYWHLDHDAPPVSGQVRFRITTCSDPATFPIGHDLQLPDGRTWHISLPRIARGLQYSGLRAQLSLEELVTEKLLNSALNSSASSLSAIAATGPRKGTILPLHTLNQGRLHAEDFVDLTGRVRKVVRFALPPGEPRAEMHYFYSGDRKNMPFPLNSRGFFYWHLESDAPPVSGQVRFRTTTSSNPATFSTGCDLQLPDGGTWNIPLFRIARASRYSGLRAQLLLEKLVTAKVLDSALNSSASYLSATSATGPRKGSAVPLRTLNQTRLDAEDCVDLTGRLKNVVRFALAPEQPRLEMHYYRSGGHKYIAFPPDCQGFFYWHLDHDAPPVSGQVRFRTTTSSSPATFSTGWDLKLPDGRTWNIPLFRVARSPKYAGLRAHLLSEKLITAKLLNTALHISDRRGEHPATDSLLIWKFGQRFLAGLPNNGMSIWIIGSSAGERFRLPHLFSVYVRESGSSGICYVLSENSNWRISRQTGHPNSLKGVNYTPLTGKALVQFERSTLPEHKGTRTVVLCILKVMTKSDDASWMSEPQDDGLDMTEIHEHCWSCNVDQPLLEGSLTSSAKALSILFDNEALEERQDGRGAES
ncbi:hypothetical protein OE88DRAFT_1654249 [Heliocybe sulcata]|uniref:Uncharacterized protein n=1 Tax=Heliocybe sulcata TaxID=5364 RepID=A0A5C3N9Y9_9AGAM|nr:hypothetical protein OE88DRAFT_1654249 [Heliocybe sulcata]